MDTGYKARWLIKEMLQDRMNYFLFIYSTTPIVKEFERFNVLFQQSYADPYDLAKELRTHNRDSLYQRLYNKDGTCKMVEKVDFGFKFDQEIRTYLISFNTSNMEQ